MTYRNRSKTLTLLKILFLESSRRHPLAMEALLRRMREEGAPAERKTVYRIVAQMNGCGICVRYRPRGPQGYYYAGGWPDGTEPEPEEESR